MSSLDAEILRRYRQGVSGPRIANDLGVTAGVVYSALRRQAEPLRSHRESAQLIQSGPRPSGQTTRARISASRTIGARARGERIQLRCATCGMEFERARSLAETADLHYCGRHCYLARKNRDAPTAASPVPTWDDQLDSSEAGARLGCSRGHVVRLIKRGKLRATKGPKSWRIDPAEVARLLRERSG